MIWSVLAAGIRGVHSRSIGFFYHNTFVLQRHKSALSEDVYAYWQSMTSTSDSFLPALNVSNLVKSFDDFRAVDNLSLNIRQGEFYALLGPNGAGKTTTLRMVAGLLQPDAGSIAVLGTDARADPIAAKRIMAWVPDEPMIYDKLTPIEYLEFIAGLWSMDPNVAQLRAVALLEQFGLSKHAGDRCQGFSKGMRQKVALTGALLHQPQVIILDEPLTGLDAGSARQVKSVLRELVATGVTIIMTTHILEVAERMADRIGVIGNGRLLAEGALDELRAGEGRRDQTLEEIFLQIVGVDESASEALQGNTAVA